MESNTRLSLQARSVIQSAAHDDSLLVSAITPWEIGVLVSKNRISLNLDAQIWMDRAIALPGIRVQPPLPAIAVSSANLPFEMHPDPADRILMATARHTGATLVTADEFLLCLGMEQRFRCLSAI